MVARFFFVLSCCALLAFSCTTACASMRLHVRAPSYFVGERVLGGVRHNVELFCLDEHFFVLRQTVSTRHRSFTRDMTGHWRQREGGAVVTLENDYGFSLRLVVGSDNLYGSFSVVQTDRRDLLSLKLAQFKIPVFTLMGTLTRSSTKAAQYDMLVDGASGRLFRVTGAALGKLPTYDALFLDCELRYAEKSAEVTRVRSFSTHIPPLSSTSTKSSFASFVPGKTWWYTPDNGHVVSLVFAEKGLLEITGSGLWAQVVYDVRGRSLSFRLEKKERDMLLACDAAQLLDVLVKTRSWSIEGTSILLQGEHGELAFLEDASQLRRGDRALDL